MCFQTPVLAGSELVVEFQQNLNHWYKGKPGHFEIAVTYDAATPTWTVLATLDDFPAHDQVWWHSGCRA